MLCQVTTKVRNGDEIREVWFFFEGEYDDLADLHDAMIQEGSIFGERIDSIPAGPGVRQETGRYETILSADIIVTVTPPRGELRQLVKA